MTPRTALERGVGELALELPAPAVDQLLAYLAVLEKWNKTYSLTAIREPLSMVKHHILDSLAVLPHLPMHRPETLADAGSGAGLPGIALAIARPTWHVVLAEANQKKAAFLRQAGIELGLRNTQVHEGRVERWQPAQRFTVVISRAFARLAQFANICGHLVATQGSLVAMKGARVGQELAETAGWECTRIALRVPFLEAERHLVICRRPAAASAT